MKEGIFCNLSNNGIKEIMQKWLELQNVPNVFAYRLDIKESKYLKGSYRIYTQLNPNRMSLRRAPETITSLKPTFNEERFNFKKIHPQEILMRVPYESSVISIIINKSPLTNYHVLICPDIHKNLPQRMTIKALKFCIEWLRSIAVVDQYRHFRIGYNSPGALASVNHLHLHLLYIEKDLYIDHAKLQPLKDNVYCLSDEMPTKALCWLFKITDTNEMVQEKIDTIYTFLEWLCDTNMPHNIFITPQRIYNEDRDINLKVFIYVREKFCTIKCLNTMNLGFCELSGYVTIGDKELYDDLTEEKVLAKINKETNHVFQKVYHYFIT